MSNQASETADVATQSEMLQPPKQSRRRSGGLPEAYTGDDGRPITRPVWRASALLYLGDTLWQEGDIVIADIVPNAQMEPLNWAAQDLYERWLNSLPVQGMNLQQVDIMEAADLLRSEAGKLTTEQFQQALIKLATDIKAKREGLGTPSALQPMVFHSGARGDAPPIANARVGSGAMGTEKPAIRGTPNTNVQRAPARAMTNQPSSGSGGAA